MREPAGRSRVTFCSPVLPSGKAKVRSWTWIVGEFGLEPIFTAALRIEGDVGGLRDVVVFIVRWYALCMTL